MSSIMEGDGRMERRQKSRECLREKGIDIDKNVTPDEARTIVYKLAVELWGHDEALIKKNLRLVAEKAMKLFVTDGKIDNVCSIDSVTNVDLVASAHNAALVESQDLGRRKRKRIVAQFTDVSDDDERELSARKQRKQSPSSRRNKNMKPSNSRFGTPEQVNFREPSPMPEDLRAAISKCGVQDITFVMEKELTASDLKKNQNRLLIPVRQVRADFLNERERGEVMRQEKITVKLVEPTEKVTQIGLNMWEMRKSNKKASYSYVLITQWNQVKEANDLHPNDVVQVWAFRTPEQELGIALAKLPPKEQSLPIPGHD